MDVIRDSIALIRRLLPRLGEVRAQWILAACLQAAGPALAACLLWSVKVLIDEVFVGRRFDQLPFIAAAYTAIAVAKVLHSYLSTRLDASITEQIAQTVRVDLYRHVLTLSPGSLRQQSNGDLLTRLSGDAERVEYLIYTGLIGLCADAFSVAVFVCVLFALSWQLTLCALIVAPMLAVISLVLAPRMRRAARVSRRRIAAWTSQAEERLGAAPIIQAFDAVDFETASFERRCAAARRAELGVAAVQARTSAVIEAIAVIGGLSVILVGTYAIQHDSLTVGTLIAFLGSIGSLYGPIGGLAKAPNRFQRAAARVQRVIELLDTQSAVSEKPDARALVAPRGEIEFKSVSFGYEPNSKVLHEVTLKIAAGETVAVVGPSGSGKSSLVKLALRLHDPREGQVLVDGHDLRDLTLKTVREAVSVVLQEPWLFRGSIAENIAYNTKVAGDSRLMAAASAAYVSEFSDKLAGGHDAPVGAVGRWLSGGQRQRIALARALYRDAPILILDEATGAVDSETEEFIQDALDRLAGRRTMVVIGHRLSTIRRADRIVVLENGRVVESGPPAVLLQTNSRCRQLFAAQLIASEIAA